MTRSTRRVAASIALAAAVAGGLLMPKSAAAQQPAPAQPAPPIVASVANDLEVGDRAPTFMLSWGDRNGTNMPGFDYSLRQDIGKVVVLVFYPQDWTPSGRTMLATLARRADELFGSDVIVMGVAPDSAGEHVRFARQLDVPFRLLSDPGLKVSSRYGAAFPFGQNRRAVFVVGRDGNVSYIDLDFRPEVAAAYTALGRAVQAAKHPVDTASRY